jgi:hypothetical protein
LNHFTVPLANVASNVAPRVTGVSESKREVAVLKYG